MEKRLSEIRFTGGHKIKIIRKIREEYFPSKGAVSFEKKIKELIPEEYRYKTNLIFPGKSELIRLEFEGEVTKLYDELSLMYKDVYGFKSAN